MDVSSIAEHISGWLKDYCEAARLDGFVVGISGGVDSALTSTLCARTGLSLHALSMPIHQAPDQFQRASQHIAWLEQHCANVEGVTIDLSSAFESFAHALPAEVGDEHTMANARSRLRMVTLAAFAGHYRKLVAGTGNKVEDFGIGFFTKYGDGGVDLSPIADLMKSEVYQIARHLGVHREILDAEPTDGLWSDARTDEAQIGASYDELEWVMRAIDDGIQADAESLSPRQRQVFDVYQRFHRMNRHKMIPIPICDIPDSLRGKPSR